MADQALYDQLASTAKAHLLSCQPQTKGSNDPDGKLILSHLAPSFSIDWGHSFWVLTAPHLQGKKTGDEFVSHLLGMAQFLQTWDIVVKDMSVDTKKKSVIVRSDFHMVPKGGEEVLNEIIFWIVMDESGEKVVKCTEFVDTFASEELAKRMQKPQS